MSFWAKDGFRDPHSGIWGGPYVDMDTPFGMREKVAHVLCGALLFAFVERWFGVPAAWGAVLVGGVVVEAVEWARFSANPRGFFADRPSWRDLVANTAGAALAWLLL